MTEKNKGKTKVGTPVLPEDDTPVLPEDDTPVLPKDDVGILFLRKVTQQRKLDVQLKQSVCFCNPSTTDILLTTCEKNNFYFDPSDRKSYYSLPSNLRHRKIKNVNIPFDFVRHTVPLLRLNMPGKQLYEDNSVLTWVVCKSKSKEKHYSIDIRDSGKWLNATGSYSSKEEFVNMVKRRGIWENLRQSFL